MAEVAGSLLRHRQRVLMHRPTILVTTIIRHGILLFSSTSKTNPFSFPIRHPCHHHLSISASHPSRTNHLQSHGLRLPESSSSDLQAEYSDSFDTETTKKSRNQKKRDARRAVRWGMELANFSAPQIKRLLRVASLDRELYDALMLVKRLGPDVREGRRRQFNYIGRLLRKAQPELMDSLIQASKDGDSVKLQNLLGQEAWAIDGDGEEEEEESGYDAEEVSHSYVDVSTRWFDGLVYKDTSITNEVYSIHNIEFDRQELRKLVRRVQSTLEHLQKDEEEEELDISLTHARKSLICFLRALARQTLAAS